jgi:hypothetical protein
VTRRAALIGTALLIALVTGLVVADAGSREAPAGNSVLIAMQSQPPFEAPTPAVAARYAQRLDAFGQGISACTVGGVQVSPYPVSELDRQQGVTKITWRTVTCRDARPTWRSETSLFAPVPSVSYEVAFREHATVVPEITGCGVVEAFRNRDRGRLSHCLWEG